MCVEPWTDGPHTYMHKNNMGIVGTEVCKQHAKTCKLPSTKTCRLSYKHAVICVHTMTNNLCICVCVCEGAEVSKQS